MRAPDLSIVVPCHAEEAQVDACVAALRGWHGTQNGLALEVVGVDDGSPDGTLARWQAWTERWPCVRVVHLPVNRGKGAALRAGVGACTGRNVVCIDVDLAVGPEHLDPLLAHLEDGADVVIGSRALPAARVAVPQGRLRRWLGRRYLRLARRLLGLRVSDVTCGFKGFRGDLARQLFGAATCERWGIDAEVLLLAQRRGARVAELPVVWRDGRRSAVRLRRDVLGSFRELLAVRERHGREPP